MRSLVTAIILVVTAAAASAQTPDPSRFSFGGTAGFGQTWDDEGSIGKGWLAGGYATLRLLSRTDAEFSVDVLRHDRDSGHFQAEGHTTLFNIGLRQRFGSERNFGYVLGAMTIASHDGTAGFPAEGIVNRNTGTHGGYMIGGGAAFAIGDRLEIGPVIRIEMLGADTDSDPASAIMTGVRIGLRK